MKIRVLLSLLSVFALVLPALAQGVDGKWEAKMTTQRGEQTIGFELKNAGGTVTGSVTAGQGSAEIKNGKLDGTKLTFDTTQQGGRGEVTFNWSGTIAGDSIKFTRAAAGGSGGGGGGRGGRGGPQEMEAKRVK